MALSTFIDGSLTCGDHARCGPGLLGAVFDVGDELRAAGRNISVVDAMG
jgi:hypothetical protein